ncbi:hypothetical protein E4582_06390 [Luteimonas yindakuii]|uniref:Uncharacterized protein n=1 Tax=Luteimonas yindakuii TaxID=2565782 RepID=A0A4Z1R781_9GAMM|nr:hypothetical protein [Luteimonas yindakuii]TKS54435.1 hypothetical protein E4582_06390 [Luteimonas yindakuii]
MILSATLFAALLLCTVCWLLLRRRGGRRQQALAAVLDAADAFEDRLRMARAEIEAVAGSDENPVREAMQEMLRQRLWLQQHGHAANTEQLDQVRASIDTARARIEQQLERIEQARTTSA